MFFHRVAPQTHESWSLASGSRARSEHSDASLVRLVKFWIQWVPAGVSGPAHSAPLQTPRELHSNQVRAPGCLRGCEPRERRPQQHNKQEGTFYLRKTQRSRRGQTHRQPGTQSANRRLTTWRAPRTTSPTCWRKWPPATRISGKTRFRMEGSHVRGLVSHRAVCFQGWSRWKELVLVLNSVICQEGLGLTC